MMAVLYLKTHGKNKIYYLYEYLVKVALYVEWVMWWLRTAKMG